MLHRSPRDGNLTEAEGRRLPSSWGSRRGTPRYLQPEVRTPRPDHAEALEFWDVALSQSPVSRQCHCEGQYCGPRGLMSILEHQYRMDMGWVDINSLYDT